MNPLLDKKFISTKEASIASGYNPDYLGRLCRSGKIESMRVGRSWLISQESLDTFAKEQEIRKEQIRTQLIETREKEYRQHSQIMQAPLERRNHKLVSSFSTAPARSVRHLTEFEKSSAFQKQGIAVIMSLGVLLFGVYAAQAAPQSTFAEGAAATAFAISDGARTIAVTTFENANDHASRLIATNAIPAPKAVALLSGTSSTYVGAADVITGKVSSAFIASRVSTASPMLAFVTAYQRSPRSLQHQLFAATTAHAQNTRRVTVEVFPLVAYAEALAQYEVGAVVHPRAAAIALAATELHAYTGTGATIYNNITEGMNAYAEGVQGAGNAALALGASIRDTSSRVPVMLAYNEISLALDWVHFSNQILHTYSDGVYAWVNGTPTIPARIVIGEYQTGTEIADATAAVPTAVLTGYEEGLTSWVATMPHIATTLASTELGVGTTALTTTQFALNTVFDGEQHAAEGAANLAYGLSNQIPHIASVPATSSPSLTASVEDTGLGFLGSADLAMQTFLNQGADSLAAAVVPAVQSTFGDKVALATYEILHGLFANAGEEIAFLIQPGQATTTYQIYPTTIITNTASTTNNAIATANTAPSSTGSGSVVRNVIEQTVVQGVTQNYVDTAIANLQGTFIKQIEAATHTEGTPQEVVENVTSGNVGGDVTATSLTVSGDTELDGNLTAATSTFNGPMTINGDVTITGTLTAPGFVGGGGGGQTVGPYFIATSTTATSTFAGSINVDNNGLVYATSTRTTTIANAVIANATLSNATTTNATSTNAFAANLVATNATATNLFGTNAVFTNATSTNFFSGLIQATTGIFNSLTAQLATITGLTTTNSTSTNATSTNLFATNAGFTNETGTNLFATNAVFTNTTTTNATSTNFNATNLTSTNFTSATGSIGSLTVTGNAALGNTTFTNATGTNLNLATLTTTGTSTVGGLAIGNLNGFLKATAGAISTSLITLTSDVTGILPIQNGGTGTSSFATNGVLYGNGTNNLLTTAQGGTNTVLVANNGAPAFSSAIMVGTSVTTPTLNATSAIELNGANINTAGTLSNVAYTNQSQSFSGTQTFANYIGTNGTTTNATSTNLFTSNLSIGALSGILKAANGIVTAAVAGTDYQVPGNYITALTGDGSAAGPGSATFTLATVNGNTGSFGSSSAIPTFTVNAKGLITAAGSVAVVAPAGTLTGTTLASNVVNSSLTSLGTLASLTVTGLSNLGNAILANATSTNFFSGFLGGNSVAIGSTASTTIGTNGVLTSPNIIDSGVTANGLLYANGSNQLSSATVSAPLSFSAGALSITQASGSTNGYLSSTDFNTFNNKISSTSLSATAPLAYNSSTGVISLTGTVGQGNGGTGITTYSPGDLIYANGSGALSNLPVGSAGQVLQVISGVPSWGNGISGGGSGGSWATTTNNLAIYPTSVSQVVIVGSSATSTANAILEVHGSSYFSGNLGIGTTTPGTLLSIGNTTGINFTTATSTFNSTGGINLANGCYAVNGVCLTQNPGTVTSVNASGGTTGLSFSGGPVTSSGTLTLAGTLGVGNGGTGSTTLTGLLKGAGTGSIVTAIAGTDYLAPSSLTATYPLQYSANNFSLAFGTTTANSWSQLQQFNGNASTTQLTVTGNTYLATTGGGVGIGAITPTHALDISGNTTASGYLRVGSNTTPNNTGAGVLTVSGLSINNASGLGTSGSADYIVGSGTLNQIASFNENFIGTTAFISPTANAVGVQYTNFSMFTNINTANNFDSTSSILAANFTNALTSAGAVSGPIRALSLTGLRAGGSATALTSASSIDGLYVTPVNSSGNSVVANISNIYGAHVLNSILGSLTATNQAGLAIQNISGATNNVGLLLGTDTIPAGNYGLYDSSANQNYFAGSTGIGSTTPGTLLSIGNTNGINFSTATSTFNSTGGVNLANGCYAVNGVCLTQNSGTVTSVNASGGTTGLTFSGGPVTSSGTLTLSGTLGIANGGTNATSFTTSGNAVYYNGTSLVTAPTTAAITIPYASSTQLTTTGSTYLATTGGSVGIGTTTPFANLSISDNYGSNTSVLFAVSSSTAANGSTGSVVFSVTPNTVNFPNGTYFNQYGNLVGSQAVQMAQGTFTSIAPGTVPLIASSEYGGGQTADIFDIEQNSGPTFDVFNNKGFLGIGSTTPAAELSLHAVAGTNYPNNLLFDVASSTASATSTFFVIQNTGNVGISTTTPGSLFSIGNTNGINFSTATSTFNSTGGINLINGCYEVNGVCALTANQNVTLTGDVTGSGTTAITTTLATVNSNTGSFGSSTAIPTFTVNGKGLITAAGTAAVIAPAGTLTGTTLASNVVSSSLTSLGTLTALTVSGNTSLGNATSTSLFANYLTANAAAFGGTASTTIGINGLLTAPNIINNGLTNNTLVYANGSNQESSVTLPSYLTLTTGTLGISQLPIAQGGTGTTTGGVTNGIEYYNGSTLTNSASITTDSTGSLIFPTSSATTPQVEAWGGTATNPGLSFAGNTNYGLWLSGSNIEISTAGTNRFLVGSGGFNAVNNNGPTIKNASADSTTIPIFDPDKSDANTGFGAGVTSNLNAIVSNVEITRWTSTGFGVSTSSPYAQLSIGISSTTPAFVAGVAGSSTPAFMISSANNSGYIGIGTSSPWALLSINPTAGSQNPQFVIGSSTGTSLEVDASGDLGVGTSTPSSLVAVGGTYTTANANLVTYSSTFASSNTSSQSELDVNGSLNPSAVPTSLNGITINPTLTGSTAINTYRGIQSSVGISSGYTKTVTTGIEFDANSPFKGGSANPITNLYGFRTEPFTNGDGTTTGIISNVGLFASSITASSSAGGTINNYAAELNLPSGSPNGGNTFNYGLYLTGNGGSSVNGGTNVSYALYDTSTARNYLAGNTGIGSTSPASILDIAGGTTIGTDYNVVAPTNGLIVEGNTGVGTTSPLARLDVAGANNATTPLFQLSSVASFATTTQFIVTNGGSVGIGTTTPGSLLSINGIANFTTATSTFYGNGLNLTNGCYAVNGTCLTQNPGTVTSVNASGGTTGLSFSGGPVTSSGTLTLSGTLGVANGGTGSTTLTGILKGNGTGAVVTAIGDTDYQKPITLTTTGSSGAATFSGDTLNIPNYSGGFTNYWTNSGAQLYNNTATEVGINNTNPSFALDVGGTGTLAQFGDTAVTNHISVSAGSAMFGYDNLFDNAVVQGGSGSGIEFAINSNTFTSGIGAILTSADQFGIGTTAPASTLAVSGGATIGADYNYTAPTNGLLVEGNTGIGTTSPFASLSITGTSTQSILAISTSSDSVTAFRVSANGNLHFLNGAGIDIGTATVPPSNGLITAGKVGIGTTTPLGMFDVEGSNGSGGRDGIYVNTTANPYGPTLTGYTTVDGTNRIFFSGSLIAQDNQSIIYGTSSNYISGYYSYLSGWGVFPQTASGGTNQADVFIANGGTNNVGIGATTTPWAQLSASTTSSYPAFAAQQLGTGAAGVFLGGNVGIGTTTPGTLLSIGNTNGINFSTATSTFNSTGGINLINGCYAVNGVCLTQNSGTVTSVNASGGTTGLTFSGGPVTSSGTLTLSGTLGIANGGTNATSFTTSGNAVYYNGTSLVTAPTTAAITIPYASSTQLTTTGSTYLATTGGSVGIGTTTPFANLSISDNYGSNTSVLFAVSSSTAANGSTGSVVFSVTPNTVNFPNGTYFNQYGNLVGSQAVQMAQGTFTSIAPGTVPLIASSEYGGGQTADIFDIEQNSGPTFDVFNNKGFLGIGSTTPAAELSLHAVAGTNYPNNLLFDVASSTASATTTFFDISNTGVVGIGTSSPYALLSVDGNAAGLGATTPLVSIKQQSGGTANLFEIRNSSGSALLTVDQYGNLAGFQSFSVTSTSGVGSSPTGALFRVNNNSASNAFNNLTLGGKTNQVANYLYVFNQDTGYGIAGITGVGNTAFGTTTTPYKLAVQGLYNTNADLFDISTSTTASGTATTSLLRVTAGGYVGIGTTTPWALLSVNPTAGSSAPEFVVGSSTGTSLEVDASGQIGINTTAPAALVGIGGTYTTANANLFSVAPTFTSSNAGTQTEFNIAGTLTPTAAASSINGLNFQPTLSGSQNMALYRGIESSVGISSGYSGLVTNGYEFDAASPFKGASARPITNLYGFRTEPFTNGDSTTTGLISNYGFYGSSITASSSAGGTINDYTAFLNLPSGAPNGGTTFNYGLYLTGNGGSNTYGGTQVSYALYDNSTARNYFLGNTGIGSTTPAAEFSIHANAGSTYPDNYLIDIASSTASATTTLFVVDNNGNVGAGTLAAGTSNTLCYSTSAITGVNVLATCSSDERLKQNITPLTDATGLSAIDALAPVSYTWNPKFSASQATQYGVIAQQVQQVLPSLISTSSPTSLTPNGTLSINYNGLFGPIIQSIHELDQRTNLISGNGSLGSTTPTFTLDASSGNVAIGAAAAASSTDKLTVSGNILGNGSATFTGAVSAGSYTTLGSITGASLTAANAVSAASFVVPNVGQSFLSTYSSLTLSSSTVASALTTDGTGVDLYKLATFTLNGVQALATQTAQVASTTNALATQMNSLSARVSALEAGAAAATASINASSTTASASTSQMIASALQSFGVLVQEGVAQFNTLVVRDIVFSKDTNGQSAAGSGTLLAGNTTVEIDNEHMLAGSQVSVTLTAPMTGNWYVTDKKDGSFRVTFSSAQPNDVTFDYLIIQTQGQVATSTADVTGNPFSWLANFLTGTSTPATPNNPPSVATPTETGTGSGSSGGSVTGGTASSTINANAPVVTLKGAAVVSIDQGGVFLDPGATAVDASGTDITSSIVVTGSVNVNTPGMYTLTYTATDAAGNAGSASRVVTVTASTSGSSSGGNSSPTASTTPSAPSTSSSSGATTSTSSSSGSSDTSAPDPSTTPPPSTTASDTPSS